MENPTDQVVSLQVIAGVRLLFRSIGSQSLSEMVAAVLASDLTLPQLAALLSVQRKGPLSLTALGAELGVSLSHASYLTDQLVQRGLLSRCEDPANRRQKIIAPTVAATELYERLLQARINGIEASLASVPEALRLELEAVLGRISTYL